LTNLLSNALKFTFRGAIHFRIRNYPNKRYLKFEIQDTGIGIKEEDQAKLFKSFGKIDLEGRTYLNPQGVGLGLVISNELAKLLYPFGL
jgi:signal transduction histidine kinase